MAPRSDSKGSAFSSIERLLRDHQAEASLNLLEKSGCSRSYLLAHLETLHQLAGRSPFNIDNFNEWTRGLDRRAMGRLADQLDRWANITEDLSDRFHPLLRLITRIALASQSLRISRNALLGFLEGNSSRRQVMREVPIAAIVRHVIECAKRPHDKEVAELVAAACHNEGYSLEVHKHWRSTHYPELAASLSHDRGVSRGAHPPPSKWLLEEAVLTEVGVLYRYALALTRNETKAEALVKATVLAAHDATVPPPGTDIKAWLLVS
jgi:hypothetical protein